VLRLVILAVFAVAMAFVEAAVVVYLRGLFYPEGFYATLAEFPVFYYGTEVFREAATIIMLASVAVLAARRNWWERGAYFLFCFGVWDIFYYVWLYALLAWPPSLMTSDVLFLIPIPWVAPVVAPVSASVVMIAASVWILARKTGSLLEGVE
jgi:tellurite resistance protein TehA-like permease